MRLKTEKYWVVKLNGTEFYQAGTYYDALAKYKSIRDKNGRYAWVDLKLESVTIHTDELKRYNEDGEQTHES